MIVNGHSFTKQVAISDTLKGIPKFEKHFLFISYLSTATDIDFFGRLNFWVRVKLRIIAILLYPIVGFLESDACETLLNDYYKDILDYTKVKGFSFSMQSLT
jgi:hypothetical protein